MNIILNDRINSTFDSIRAEKTLKENTLLYLCNEINKRINKKSRFYTVKLAFACIAIILIAGFSFYKYYMTPNIYIDVEINPSIELTVNAFNNVIAVYAYNQDGEDIISNYNLMYMNYNHALSKLINAVDEKGFIQDNGFISVTLQSNNLNRENELLNEVRKCVESVVLAHHDETSVEVFPVNEETRIHAHELNLTPAKYLAIIELMEVDSTATIEGCMGHSIGQIRNRAREYNTASENDYAKESDKMCGTTETHHGHNYHGGRSG